MKASLILPAVSFLFPQVSARWLGIPTVPFVDSVSTGSFSLKSLKSIIVNTHHAESVNTEGETLIPPTLKAFAHTFSDDLSTSLGLTVPVKTSHFSAKDSIFITIGNSSTWLDAAGRPTSEGYSIDVTSDGIVITGASALGAWWATRSILQQGILDPNMDLSYGSATDAPGWEIRGAFLDVGRHYYPPDFIIEMCSYLSFFKQNTFHLHLSDSLGILDFLSMEEKLTMYSSTPSSLLDFNVPIEPACYRYVSDFVTLLATNRELSFVI